MRTTWLPLTLGALVMSACSSTGTVPVAPMATSELAVQVYAAGSLRGALTAIAKDYEVRTGQKVVLTFGASGLLRERIEAGEGAQVFASANMEHPQALAAVAEEVRYSLFPHMMMYHMFCALDISLPSPLRTTSAAPPVARCSSSPRRTFAAPTCG